jgi:hypothetical protein
MFLINFFNNGHLTALFVPMVSLILMIIYGAFNLWDWIVDLLNL